MGDGYGFRKIRHAVGVTAFGINAIVLPPGYATGVHYHDEQEETYFVHSGEVEFRFGDGTHHWSARRRRPRQRRRRIAACATVGDEDAIVMVAGGKDGYVGRDGQAVGGDPAAPGPPAPPPTSCVRTAAARPARRDTRLGRGRGGDRRSHAIAMTAPVGTASTRRSICRQRRTRSRARPSRRRPRGDRRATASARASPRGSRCSTLSA